MAVAASVIFGVWFFSKEGCKGDGSNGMTGPEGTLCWSGDSLADMFGGGGNGEDPEMSIVEQAQDLRPNPSTPPAGMRPGIKHGPAIRSKGKLDVTARGSGNVGAGLAQAFASQISDQITVA